MFYVEIVELETGKVIDRIGPIDERKAERVESGVRINMNHAEYSTRIVPA